MAGKYRALTEFLSSCADEGRDSVEFTFDELDDLVGGLPESARQHRTWWGNTDRGQALAWHTVGWRVDRVSLDRYRVRFARGRAESRRVGPGRSPSRTAAVLVTETDAAELDVRVHMTWQRAGPITLDATGRLQFPSLPQTPGVYRITLSGGGGKPRVYVGETIQLRRRAAHYRNPGSTQQTNERLNRDLGEHLRAGGEVTMAVATHATIAIHGEEAPLQLSQKTSRVLVEHAALALTHLNGDAVVINKDRAAD